MCCWNFSYNKAKLIKKLELFQLFRCKIIYSMCRTVAQVKIFIPTAISDRQSRTINPKIK